MKNKISQTALIQDVRQLTHILEIAHPDPYFKGGGQIVGVPLGQAGNSCGDIRSFELEHSKIRGSVSTKSFIAFPDDPETGALLRPQHGLTYEQFKGYDFDESAALRYALALIADLN